VLQGYYDEDMDSEMTESQVDEEVAVTKRGRAVKMPAKYKAEVSLCSTLGFLARCSSGMLERDLHHVLEVLTVLCCMIAHRSDCNSQHSEFYHHD